jgi:type III secretion system FlhB-like substrate exporter
MPSPIPVRRVSERLKKDMGIRIEEKNRRMAVKRNLEGNSCIPESNFSCLASKEIIDISKKMGVNMNDQNMESIELLKEMELARQCLGQKKMRFFRKKRKIIWLSKMMNV